MITFKKVQADPAREKTAELPTTLNFEGSSRFSQGSEYGTYVQAEVVLNLVNSKWPRRSSGFSVTSHMQPCACRRSL